jgi:HAD superfamily hydrolase (TIGR01549 family)
MERKIKAVLFDLDGTLLPMDQEVFVKAYFGGLSKRLMKFGYEPEKLISAIWQGTAAMIKNDGQTSNEEKFWNTFSGIFGEKAREDEGEFEKYYIEDFDKVKEVCGYDERAKEIVGLLKSRGYRVALATNPIFPAIATRKRIGWAGLTPDDFEYFTTYENSRYTKPNLKYYEDVIKALGVSAEECLMVGNDVGEDMVAERLGMKVFLLTDCIINKNGEDISKYPHGSFDDLAVYIEDIIE